MRRWALMLALLLSVGVNAGLAGAILLRRFQPAPAPPPAPALQPAFPGAGLRLMAERLGLDAAKRQQFLEFHRQFFEQNRPRRERLLELRAVLQEELLAPESNRPRLDQALAETQQLVQQLDQSMVELVLEVKPLLTAGQLAEYLRFVQRLRNPAPGPPRPLPRRWRNGV